MHDSVDKVLPSTTVLLLSDSPVDIAVDVDTSQLILSKAKTVSASQYDCVPLVVVICPSADSTESKLLDLITYFETTISHCVPVLLYDQIDASLLMSMIRSGLFEAVSTKSDSEHQKSVFTRAIATAEARVAAILLNQQHKSTSKMMLKHRDSLRERIEKADDGLVSSHNKLERTLTELNDQMAQLSLLYKFGRELSSASNWDKTLENMLENLAGFVEAKGAALVLRPSPESPFSPRKTFHWDEPNLQNMLDRLETEREKLASDQVASHGTFLVKADGEGSPPVSALPLDHKSICLGYLLLLGFGDSEQESKYLPLLNAIQIILAEEVASAQMLDRMRELSTFNSQVLETVNSGIWVLDQDGLTIYCNRQGRELLSGKTEAAKDYSMPTFGIGRGRAETTPNSAASFLRNSAFSSSDQSELFGDNLLSIDSAAIDLDKLLNSPAIFTGEGTIQQPGGQLVPVLVQSSPMQGQNSSQHWLVVVLDDLRVTKKLEAEKVRADNLESLVEMSATLAHEIRNPLMGLSAQAELLLENLDPDDDKVRYLDVITGEVTRINNTITRMLNYTRPYEPELVETDLVKLVEDCVVLSSPRCQSKNISISTQFNIDAGDKYAVDGSQVKQVIMNILFNAIDASHEDGVVAMEVNDTTRFEQIDISSGVSTLVDGVEISITDSGTGFSINDSEKLFRPFFTTKTTGTGLGLSMSKKIVEAHKGSISAESSGGCTVFKFCIPA